MVITIQRIPQEPEISPHTGEYEENVVVSMSCSDLFCSVWYTKDSSDPRTSGTAIQYSVMDSIILYPGDHHIRAISNVSQSTYHGYSEELHASYVIYGTIPAPILIPPGESTFNETGQIFIEALSGAIVEYQFVQENESISDVYQPYTNTPIEISSSGTLYVNVWKNYYVPNNATANYFVNKRPTASPSTTVMLSKTVSTSNTISPEKSNQKLNYWWLLLLIIPGIAGILYVTWLVLRCKQTSD